MKLFVPVLVALAAIDSAMGMEGAEATNRYVRTPDKNRHLWAQHADGPEDYKDHDEYYAKYYQEPVKKPAKEGKEPTHEVRYPEEPRKHDNARLTCFSTPF